MPGYKGHLSVGGVVGIALLVLLSAYCPSRLVAVQWILCCLAGSLFPDIDVKSKGQHTFYWMIFLILIVCIVYKNMHALSICSVLAVTPMLVKHRGIFHRGWFVIAAPLLGWCVITQYTPDSGSQLIVHTIFFIIGALSHLWLDQGWRRMWRW